MSGALEQVRDAVVAAYEAYDGPEYRAWARSWLLDPGGTHPDCETALWLDVALNPAGQRAAQDAHEAAKALAAGDERAAARLAEDAVREARGGR